MKFHPIFFVVCLLFIAPVSANNFYAGLNLGLMSQSGDFTVLDDGTTNNPLLSGLSDYQMPDDDALLYSLFAGYKLGSDLFLEVGYAKNSELESELRAYSTGSNSVVETSETDYMYASVIGLWPIGGSWAFNARLGFSVWNIDYSQTEVDTSLLEADAGYIVNEQFLSDNASALFVGAGLSYGFSKNLEFKLNLENHFVDFSFTNLEVDYDAISLTIGTAYHF